MSSFPTTASRSNLMRMKLDPYHHSAPLLGRWSRLVLAILVCGLAVSCSRGVKKCYPVKGKVLLNGQPTAGAMVVFYPETPDSPTASGITDAQGQFELSTYNT